MLSQNHLRKTLVHIGVGMLITALLIVLKIGFEQTAWGKSAEQLTYTLLLNVLPQYSSAGQAVVVIDISHVRGGTTDHATGRNQATSRSDLTKIIGVLSEIGPTAIAIDVDFGPDRGDWKDPNDVSFFEYCLNIHKNIPVTLGIYTTMREPQEAWLGLPKFASLAGALWLPKDGLERVPISVQDPKRNFRLKSIGFKLASSWVGGKSQADRSNSWVGNLEPWIQRFRERTATSPIRKDGLLVQEVLTNHASVNQLRASTIRFTEAEGLRRYKNEIQGRMVLLGAVDDAKDMFSIPGQESEIPGVFVHASSAMTLASVPIYEFSHGLRFILDVLIAFVVLVVTIFAVGGKTGKRIRDERERARILRWAIVIIVIGGFALVWIAQVMWLDFAVIGISLLLHQTIEKRFATFAH